jgi:hypothetical protein
MKKTPPVINLTMNMMDAMMAMSEGNPGAISALMGILETAPKVDPKMFGEGFGHILMFDTLSVRGSNLYVLWNDFCGRDTKKLLALARAYQLGQLEGVTEEKLHSAVDYGQGLGKEKPVFDFDKIIVAVRAEVGGFE